MDDAKHDRDTALAVLKELSRDMRPDYDMFGNPILRIRRGQFEDIRKKFLDKKPDDIFNDRPLARINLNRNPGEFYHVEHKLDEDSHTHSMTAKILAEFVRKEDDYIMDEIIKFAKSEGVSTLYLVDKEFVLTAFRNEIERRKKKETKKECVWYKYEVNVGGGACDGSVFLPEDATDDEIRLAIMDDLYDVTYEKENQDAEG